MKELKEAEIITKKANIYGSLIDIHLRKNSGYYYAESAFKNDINLDKVVSLITECLNSHISNNRTY